MRSWKEIQADIDVKRDDLAELFEKTAGEEGKYDMSPEQVKQVREINDELTALSKELEEAKEIDAIYQDHARQAKEAHRNEIDFELSPVPEPAKAKEISLGKMVVESEAYKNRVGKDFEQEFPDVDVKTLFQTSAGFAPESVRTGRIEYYPARRVTVPDMIPQTTTSQAAIKYMEETTFTNAAAPRSEGGAYAESALAYIERSVTVESVGHFIPVTDEQLEDVPQMRSILDGRLIYMVMLALEEQLITGDGNTPNLAGFLNKTGVGSQAKGEDSVPDAIYKAMTTVRSSGFAEPSGMIIHPNDWQAVRLLTTTDGLYIWGNPSEAGPERIWGLPLAITTAITENTGLLGDFPLFSELFIRRGVVIESSKSHSDYFVKGKQAIRAGIRAALAIYRPAAFCKVTGI